MGPSTSNFTVVINSRKWGVCHVTAPLRFKSQILAFRWNVRNHARPGGPLLLRAQAHHGKTMIYMHSLVWSLLGRSPAQTIDHRDRDSLNNSEDNLRAATHSQNNMNRRATSKNPAGLTGVTWHAPSGKWRAQLRYNGKSIHIGRYRDLDAAVSARNAAAERTFGEFAAT